jgi:Zn-dependent peptidase ImmA (M78 family)
MLMPQRDKDELENIAKEMRRTLNIDNQRQPDMMTAIIKLKRLGRIKNYLRVTGSLTLNAKAEFDPTTRLLRFEEGEFRAMNGAKPHGRFTTAHEIAHIWLEHSRVRFRGATSIVHLSPVKRDEFEANYVAAAFLMPMHLLPKDPHQMTAKEIANFFNVSVQAAEIRKPELERLWRKANKVQRPLPQSVIDYLKDRKK